ncbi:hypothetical protein VNO78_15406 [Psophocarpus tetragonolobus]|uniref:phosphopantothenoylcysteine decarboxylase n=1 Tax=Psophocarpus tetragonolobus TaxID=3891 RepID=A0AAN9SEZ1_PSOTE
MDCSNPAVIKAKSEGIMLVESQRKPRILLGACGCIDAAKFELLCHEFSKWARIAVCVTESSSRFIDSAKVPEAVKFYSRPGISDSNSIKLLEWADIMVIAPLSAHTLAKIVGGICDNLLTSVVRGWDHNKPIYVAPSMHPFMWKNPLTKKHCDRIQQLGITLMEPLLRCSARGRYASYAMPEPSEISYTVKISHESIVTYYSL